MYCLSKKIFNINFSVLTRLRVSLPVQYKISICLSSSVKTAFLPNKMKPTGEYLTALRNLMRNQQNNSLDAYIIPSDDCHQSEYICDHDQRRAFISGFDGSAGTAVVTMNNALLWTDGRYYQQALQQMDDNWSLMKDGLPTTLDIGQWLNQNLSTGSKIGTDPNLMSFSQWDSLQKTLECEENTLIPLEHNLIDQIWHNQPSLTSKNVITMGLELTGKTVCDKLIEIRKEMIDKNTDILVITNLDEIAWCLNLRGSDINYNPVFFSYVIITSNDLLLFINESKLPQNINGHFETNNVNVTIKKYDEVKTVLSELVQVSEKKIWISKGSCFALTALIPKSKRLQKITPIALMKSIKNDVEIEGFKNCHIRDGIALCQYFAWLENAIKTGVHVDEISGADKLEEFRKKREKFMGLSFTTISGSGKNGSVIHYNPQSDTNRAITDTELYLCDSGAQYLDGTTDVTRTFCFGTPTPFQVDCYTRVLKGQISLGTAIFPNKVKGQVLDTLARKYLWDVGLDYRHGTGHGVGHFLCVHEGPMGIGIRLMPDDPGLEENMIMSNEPGYYEDGEFGIRIEDLVQIVPATLTKDFAGRGALTFNTITMCPIQTKMIDVTLLTEQEKSSLNNYHQRVLNTLLPILEKEEDFLTSEWLKRETLPI